MKKGLIALFISVLMLAGVVVLAPAVATDVDPELNIAACNLAFEDTIYIKYAVKGNFLDDVKLLIWTAPQTDYKYGTQNSVLSPLGTETLQGQDMLIFQYTKLAAKQMTDVVYARAYVEKSGTYYYSNIQKYSVLQYVYNKIGKTGEASPNPKLITLLNSMLTYGSDAQKYFEYKTDRLADSDFYQVKVENGTLDDLCAKGLYKPGDSISLIAPEVNEENVAFAGWQNSSGVIVANTATANITVGTKNETYTAVYGAAAASPLEFDSNGDGTCVVTGLLEHESTDIVIPQYSPDGDLVVGIESSAFSEEDITSITIPESIEEIGRNAFNNCNALTDVYYGGSREMWEDISIKKGNDQLDVATIHYAKGSAQYSVKFIDWDGTVLKEEVVNEGEAATPPTNPTREGYSFTGWSGSYTSINADTTITAMYTLNSSEKYSVVFYDYDGTTVLKNEEVLSGRSATPPAASTKEDAIFLGWNGNYANVSQNETLRAVYSDEKNVIMVESGSGSIGSTVTVLVSIDGKVKTCGFDINILYDSNLELVSYDDDMDLDIVVNTDAFENGMKLNFSSASDKTKQRDIIELTFQIKNTTKTLLPISISVNSIKEISGNNPADTTYSVVYGVIAVN